MRNLLQDPDIGTGMYPELEDMAPAPAQDIDQIKKHKKIAI
jgi:hypothetical protein